MFQNRIFSQPYLSKGRTIGKVVVHQSVRLSVCPGSALVPSDKALAPSYRLSLVTMSPSAVVRPQFSMKSFKLQVAITWKR